MDRSICYSSLFIQAYTRNVSNMVSVCVCVSVYYVWVEFKWQKYKVRESKILNVKNLYCKFFARLITHISILQSRELAR